MWTNEQKIIIATTALTNINPEYKLDFWQEWYLCQNFQFTHTLKARRVGYSYINAMDCVVDSSHPKMFKFQKVLISYNMTDSMEKIKEARNIYMNLPESWRKPLITDSKTALEFSDDGGKSKSQIISLPNRALRGFGTTNPIGGCLIDEMPMIRDAENIYTSAIPTLARGGTMDIGGTPLSKEGLFYDIYTDKEKYPDFKRLVIPWWFSSVLCNDVKTAITEAEKLTTPERVDKFGQPILKKIFQNSGLHQFQQEFELQFQDENESFITMQMIMSCTPQEVEQYEYKNMSELLSGVDIPELCTGYNKKGELQFESVHAPAYDPDIHGILYAGMDIGRSKDASIFTIIGEIDGKYHLWMSYEMKNTEFDEQKDFVSLVMNSLPIHRLLIDSTGLGIDFGEWAEKKFPTKAEGVTFTNEIKETMANRVYLACERAQYVLPNNRKLQADIHCIRRSISSTGKSRYDGSTKDSHADRFWSMALATLGISIAGDDISRFYSQRRKKKELEAPQQHKNKKVNTGNAELDRIMRKVRRAGRGRS